MRVSAVLRISLVLSLFLSLLKTSLASGQEAPTTLETQAAATQFSWWGSPAAGQINLGMWTYHIGTNLFQNQYNANNQLFSLTYRGLFAGTLLNSFYQRSYAAGIQRTLFSHTLANHVQDHFGYRLGLMYGYGTEEIQSLTGLYLPLVPFPQLIYGVDWNHVGVEVSWTVYVVSAGFYIWF